MKLGYDIVRYLQLYLEGGKPKPQLVKKHQSVTLDRRGRGLVTFVVWTMFLILSVFRHDCEEVLS